MQLSRSGKCNFRRYRGTYFQEIANPQSAQPLIVLRGLCASAIHPPPPSAPKFHVISRTGVFFKWRHKKCPSDVFCPPCLFRVQAPLRKSAHAWYWITLRPTHASLYPHLTLCMTFESDPSFYFILYRHISFFLVWPLCMTLNLIFLFTLFYMGIFFGIRP